MIRRMGLGLVLAAVFAVTGCGFLGIGVTGSGFVTEETWVLKSVDEVESGSGFSVDVLPGDTWSVVVRTDDNILPHVEVTQIGSRVVIGLESGFYLPTTLRATVTLPALAALELSGGSVGYVAPGFEPQVSLTLGLSGGSSASVGPIDAGSAHADLSGGSTLSGELRCPGGEVTLVLSGGSQVGSLRGEASALVLEQSGGGSSDLSAFAAVDGRVVLSGGSVAQVAVASTLDVELSGGSVLAYDAGVTGPVIVRLEISGGSEITTF